MTRNCLYCLASAMNISRYGSFIRRSDKKVFQRFRCSSCTRTFSEATSHACYRQKKRKLNPIILKLLCSQVSQRRIARLLNINRITVERKFRFLASQARLKNAVYFNKMQMIQNFQFDDLETIEHTKMKPLSVTMAVEFETRKIIGFSVSQMPAKGLLARKSRKKYGHRADHRAQGRQELFEKIKSKISVTALIESDQNPHYGADVRKWFPKADHRTTKGIRGCVAGQGELKKTGYDPLFSLNHTFAMLRANINRLNRKTWCTTKKPIRLKDHIDLYVYYHNQIILN